MTSYLPLQYYEIYYYNILLLIVIASIGKSKIKEVILSYFIILFLLFFIGMRPISYHFGDMGRYAIYYNDMKFYNIFRSDSDLGFYYLMFFLSRFVSDKTFFFILSLLYILPLYFATKKMFPKYHYFAFLFLVSSFSFFSYGTNGLRNGIATSFFILGLAYKNNWKLRWLWFLLAASFHSSLLVAIGSYILTKFYNNYKFYFSVWFFSIILSLTMGSFWENFFLKLGLGVNEKIAGYFTNKDLYQESFSSIGFRWDFLIYSAIPIFTAYYFIVKKGFKDRFYYQIINIYLIANSFWILVIRASFSNRFAYLSWFLMGLVIAYPFLKNIYWKNQYMRLGFVLLLYYSFTYFMNVIYY